MTTQQHIQRLTGISDEQYGQFVFDMGIAYALHYTGGDEQGVQWMTETSSFWQWWKNQWEQVDARFVTLMMTGAKGNKKELCNIWKGLHQPEAMNLFPGKQVMEETYERMLDKVANEKLKKVKV